MQRFVLLTILLTWDVEPFQARVIHNSSPEWIQIKEAAERARNTASSEGDEVGEMTCSNLSEALELSRCLFLMRCATIPFCYSVDGVRMCNMGNFLLNNVLAGAIFCVLCRSFLLILQLCTWITIARKFKSI